MISTSISTDVRSGGDKTNGRSLSTSSDLYLFFERETGFYFQVNVYKLKKTDSRWKYTFWHNFFFNQYLNENIAILHFKPIKSQIKKIN